MFLFVLMRDIIQPAICACSSVDRAFGSGPKGRRFDSCQAYQRKPPGFYTESLDFKGFSAFQGKSEMDIRYLKKALAIPLAALLAVLAGCAGPQAVQNPVKNPGAFTPPPDASGILLVNATHPLPEDYRPGDLVNLYDQKGRHFQLARADIEVCAPVFAAMDEMFAAAREDGVDGFIVSSGYRSREKQTEVFEEAAGGTAAKPGESEHETGLAFDVTAMGNKDFDKTPQYRWLREHCWEYGFILRYPEGAQDITGYPYEPWHFRYVGLPHAQTITANGITLEEYLEKR
jgi:D-alanyl-D-alanine carboxypeptidase